MTALLPGTVPAATQQGLAPQAPVTGLWAAILLHQRALATGAMAGAVMASGLMLALPPGWTAFADMELVAPHAGSLERTDAGTVLADALAENQGVMALSAPVLDRAVVATAEDMPGLTASALRQQLRVRRLPRTMVWRISATASTPQAAARLANVIAHAWVKEHDVVRSALTTDLSNRLNKVIPELEARLREDETAAAELRRQSMLAPDADASLPDRQLVHLNMRLAEARAATHEAQTRLERFTGAGAGEPEQPATPAMLAMRQSMTALAREEAALATRYGPGSPERSAIRAQIGAVTRAIAEERRLHGERLRARAEEAGKHEQALRASLGAQASSATPEKAASPASTGRLREVERRAAASRASYEHALARLHSLQLANSAGAPAARIMSPAQAADATRVLDPAHALPLGAAAGAALALAAMTLRMRARDPCLAAQQVARDLGVERVAEAPLLGRQARKARGHVMEPATVVAVRPQSRFTESFRALRQLLDAQEGAGAARKAQGRLLPVTGERGRVILVTSAGPGDGKTTTAIGLALTLAAAGRRVALLDADLRRCGLSTYFGLRAHTGLAEILRDGAPFSKASAKRATLVVVPAGVAGQDGPATLQDMPVSPLLQRLACVFDDVILDAPPLDVTEDASILLASSDAVVLALRWAQTPRARAIEIAHRLKNMGKPCAVMLAQVDLRRLPGSGPLASHRNAALRAYFHG